MDDTVNGDRDATQDSNPAGEFGRYELLSLLGAGGMGQVWRARDLQTNRVVALKVLPENSADDAEPRERFRRECQAVAQLTEPHVIPIHDFGDIDGRLYLNMRLVDGIDLRTLIKQDGTLSPRRAVAIIAQVAGALQAAHDVGLVHRDVKPSNILVCANDFAYLIDFGIAHASEDKTLTRAGQTIGTAAYMAPEAIGAAVKAHSQVDVYALACVLHECLTGSPPFTSEMGVQGLIAHHLYTPPPKPSATNSDVPVAFDAIIAKGMAKNPDDRYQTVQQLAASCRAAVGDSDVAADMAVTRPVHRIRLSRKAIMAIGAAGAVAVVAVAAVLVANRPSSDKGRTAAPAVGQGYSSQTALPFPDVRLATGVAVDAAGTAYVTDVGTDLVLRLAVGAETPTVLPFTGLKNPRDVAVDAGGNVYVADSSNDRVLRLAAGAPAAIPLPFSGLNDPRGVAVDAAGDVFVTDRGNDRVLRLAAGAPAAIPLPLNGLNDPRGVAVDAAGDVDVTDTGNNRVLRLAAGAPAATALPFSGLNDPQGLAVDTHGSVYVTDRGNAGVLRLQPGAAAATPLPFSGLNDPQGVSVDAAGDVYVTDVGKAPVVKLSVG
ncbi:protein kinase [Mycobacterium sp. CBMA293]|uniref:serine/threonine-protein kinase PknD n=1 Tax=unclassified Mycolicibacterium TaxID=2636767 RepID=UPI0012DC49BC|nr:MULTISPECIES: serine/threonine-protein kinase PknD [unclassified Mycolicibacterium]MUL48766.1 protein kinase [Mycolicibacterium sp. CBMA 360]MUL62221.1 protein kinase [Mycolicibacterium sp. CBMA 335]MUL71682.1 protein kinase [Mycolicibacterium sp. CBMA 311]MUL93637.1 protein kinase [Mycolicibacterium sp. CBMA 230]MUM09319.1 serine/threonine protein kinase [Mycolicibacterium sp. CBMA 213]